MSEHFGNSPKAFASLPASDLTLSVPRTGLQGLKSKRYLNMMYSNHSESSYCMCWSWTQMTRLVDCGTHTQPGIVQESQTYGVRDDETERCSRHSVLEQRPVSRSPKVKPKEKNPHHIHVTSPTVGWCWSLNQTSNWDVQTANSSLSWSSLWPSWDSVLQSIETHKKFLNTLSTIHYDMIW